MFVSRQGTFGVRLDLVVILLLVVPGVLTSGCGQGTGTSGRIAVSSEFGFIVLSISGLWETDWPSREIVRIDTVLAPEASDPAIGEISAVAVSTGGRIAILDGMVEDVWVGPEPNGAWVRVVGQGEGPAELGSATGAWWVGDTLVIFDARRSRLLRLADGMTPLGTGVPLPGTRESGFRTVPFGDSTGFLALLSEYPDIRQAEGVQRPDLAAVWVSVTSGAMEPPDTIGRWPGRAYAIPPQGGIAVQPFGVDTHVDVSARGIAVTDGAVARASIMGLDGRSKTEIRWEETDRPVREEMPGFMQRLLKDVPADAEPATRTLLESLPYPEQLPQTGGVVMGAGSDEIWLAEWFGTEVEYRGHTRPGIEWRVVGFGPHPSVERLMTPPGVLPLEILSQEEVLVLLRDDLDRQGVGYARLEGARYPDG